MRAVATTYYFFLACIFWTVWAVDGFVMVLLLPTYHGQNGAAGSLGDALRVMFMCTLIITVHGTMLSSSSLLCVSCAKGA